MRWRAIQMHAHEHWMGLALELARRGAGNVSPNPLVGALVVHDGKILARGYHACAGGPHAEAMAIGQRRGSAFPHGAVLYVTLEPCCTEGRTPACTGLILRSGLRDIVVGGMDPNPAHCGRGIRILRRAGLRVLTGVLKGACEGLNPAFRKYITSGMPYVVAKMAMSLDGKAATVAGDSHWISSEASRALVQRMRHAADALIVGAGTVRRDNPRLTLRDKHLPPKKRPLWRIVVDSRFSLPVDANIFKAVRGHLTCVATTRAAAATSRARRLEKNGVRVIGVDVSPEGIALRDLFRQLAGLELSSVMVEGGPALLASCLREKLVDRLAFFVAPKIVGGLMAPGPVGGAGVRLLRQAFACGSMTVSGVGEDLLIECSPAL